MNNGMVSMFKVQKAFNNSLPTLLIILVNPPVKQGGYSNLKPKKKIHLSFVFVFVFILAFKFLIAWNIVTTLQEVVERCILLPP